jgi:hypothetical protein
VPLPLLSVLTYETDGESPLFPSNNRHVCFINLKMKSTQFFKGTHRDRVWIHVYRDECSYSYVYEYLRLYCVSIKKRHVLDLEDYKLALASPIRIAPSSGHTLPKSKLYRSDLYVRRRLSDFQHWRLTLELLGLRQAARKHDKLVVRSWSFEVCLWWHTNHTSRDLATDDSFLWFKTSGAHVNYTGPR